MSGIKVKLRFDYAGKTKSGKLFFGGKNIEDSAEENRQKKATLLRNIPIQGIYIEDIDMSQDVYVVYDDFEAKNIAYAPVSITLRADGLEELVKFSMKEELRRIEVIEPDEMHLSKQAVEHLVFKINNELIEYKEHLLRRVENWK